MRAGAWVGVAVAGLALVVVGAVKAAEPSAVARVTAVLDEIDKAAAAEPAGADGVVEHKNLRDGVHVAGWYLAAKYREPLGKACGQLVLEERGLRQVPRPLLALAKVLMFDPGAPRGTGEARALRELRDERLPEARAALAKLVEERGSKRADRGPVVLIGQPLEGAVLEVPNTDDLVVTGDPHDVVRLR